MSQDEPKIGERVTEFSLPRLDGAASSLSELAAGKAALAFVFWSAVCSHCRRYDAYLNELSRRHPGLGVVAIAARQGETATALGSAVRERGLAFPILHDAERALARRWLVEQTPRVFLIDADLRLVYRGAIDNFKYPNDPDHEAYLDDAIDAVLAGAEVPRAETSSFGCPVASVYYEMPKP